MKLLKFLTPFILAFPGWMVLAALTWLGKFENYNLVPMRGTLFIAIGFTMIIVDLFLKYFIGKNRIYYVWIIEVIVFIILASMIIPKFKAEIYV